MITTINKVNCNNMRWNVGGGEWPAHLGLFKTEYAWPHGALVPFGPLLCIVLSWDNRSQMCPMETRSAMTCVCKHEWWRRLAALTCVSFLSEAVSLIKHRADSGAAAAAIKGPCSSEKGQNGLEGRGAGGWKGSRWFKEVRGGNGSRRRTKKKHQLRLNKEDNLGF